MKFNKSTLLVLAMTAALMTGCSSNDAEDSSTADATNGSDASTAGLNDGSLNGSQFGNNGKYGSNSRLGPEFSDPNNPLSKQVIYFELDSSQVKQDYVPVVAAHARYLVGHPNQRVILAGNADERGSSEYNIALGEQRAKSVEKMMRTQGVGASQLEIVSYGEEKPVVSGHSESAWSQNRRVEVEYQ